MIEKSTETVWKDCLEFIQDNVAPSAYKELFAGIRPVSLENGELTIAVASAFVYEYIEENYLGVMRSALTKVIGPGTKLKYRVMTDKQHKLETTVTSQDTADTGYKETTRQTNAAPALLKAPQPQDLDPMLNPKYSFDNFIEGVSNKLSRTAAETVAQNPARSTFNPLFIYGASGVGKTHLVNAIGMKVKSLFPEKRVLYVSSHLFHVQYVDSVRNNTVNDFINFYQTIDVLIIDDMQELAGYSKTQNTFFHIFNHLHLNQKQLIMTCDRPPKDLKDLEERLITRFKWGLVAELEKPNYELRKEILRDKTRRDGIEFPEDVIDYIAQNVKDSVRDLEGTIVSLVAHSTIYNKDVDLDLARSVIEKASVKEEKPLTIEGIINKVCEYYDIEADAIQTKSRKSEVVQVRQISMYLAKKYLDYSTSKIGMYIGKRDHATVLHACTVVKDQIEVDKNFREDMQNIESSLRL
ncbi:MAG: chromosomal replication initiator protein DnaA [Bacteroidaceae bacterium]|nr:chromosomal replication initiator protein DnaA [Bacteroidaceae bacterium]